VRAVLGITEYSQGILYRCLIPNFGLSRFIPRFLWDRAQRWLTPRPYSDTGPSSTIGRRSESLARSLPACIWTNSLRLTPEQLAEPLAADSLKLNAEYVWTYINRQELRVTVRQSQACTGLALYRPSPAGGALVESMYPKGCSPSKGKLVEV